MTLVIFKHDLFHQLSYLFLFGLPTQVILYLLSFLLLAVSIIYFDAFF